MDGDQAFYKAAKVCRDEYCRRLPGKRTWDELSQEEKELDVICLRAAFNTLATPLLTIDDIQTLLRTAASPYTTSRKGSSGISAWCAAHGVARSHAFEFLKGQRMPCTDMLEALGLEWRIMRKTI